MKEKIDPRTKICIVASLSTLAILYTSVMELAILFVIGMLIVVCFGVHLIQVLRKMKRLLGMVAMITILQSLFTRVGTPILFIGNITFLTDYGLERGLVFVLRMGIILMFGILLSTSSNRALTQGLIQLKLPYEVAFMSTLGGKFLPILREEFVDSLNTFMLRGVELNKLRVGQKIKVYTYILTPVFMNSVLKAKQLSIAMELRGFRIQENRTSFFTLQFKGMDYILIVISLGTLIAGIAGKVWFLS